MIDKPDLFETVIAEPALRAAAPIRGEREEAPPPLIVRPFPLAARVGRIRDVATKLIATKSDRHAASYRAQVEDALRANLAGKQVPVRLHDGELGAFWRGVELEVARQLHSRRQA